MPQQQLTHSENEQKYESDISKQNNKIRMIRKRLGFMDPNQTHIETRLAHNIGNKPADPGNSCGDTQNPIDENYQ